MNRNTRILTGIALALALALSRGTHADVIRGIDGVVNDADVYDIRVLDPSFSAEPRSHYRDDARNRAVMAAWQSGIVAMACSMWNEVSM